MSLLLTKQTAHYAKVSQNNIQTRQFLRSISSQTVACRINFRSKLNFPVTKFTTTPNPVKSNIAMDAKAEEQRKLKIYTRTGDKGTSALYTGERRSKDDVVFEALGTVDELNSFLGLAGEYCDDPKFELSNKLEKVQSLLQDVGSNIATPRKSERSSDLKLSKTAFDEEGLLTKELEDWIDELDAKLPPLKNFILPVSVFAGEPDQFLIILLCTQSGGKLASTLHVARSVCRRAERRIVPLREIGGVDESVSKYVNRYDPQDTATA
ncbi:hypothetical protein HK098_001615 [Nowakowskiella sp. JEL0407]|nr:hypothetical protein HK098_001615 [Nowakowskiella sp. JEL0407]